MFTFLWLRQLQRRWFGRRAIRRVHVRRAQLCLEVLEDRLTPSVVTINVNDNSDTPTYSSTVTYAQLQAANFQNVTLRDALNAANNSGDGNSYVINLQTNTTYDLTQIDNYWYGPDGLPAIASNITISGNGAVIERDTSSGTPDFRLFYVSGGFDGLAAGSLTLNDLTLEGGVAQGGSSNGGGGGLGAGGAIFNQGTLDLTDVTLANNEAVGGSGNDSALSSEAGGGGMGGNADSSGDGGGFGGSLAGGPYGGSGGSGSDGGGGGGGFQVGDNGQNASGRTGGAGGGQGGFGGNGGGDGGGGGSGDFGVNGGIGGSFGSGGAVSSTNGTGGGGGGGVGGGGSYANFGVGGAGGFGGGGGWGNGGGAGGFGGGGGAAGSGGGGIGGFGGGDGVSGYSSGGGGGGMGGALFNMFGSLTLSNCTVTGNTAQGGSGGGGGGDGSGYGGAIFNLDGTLGLTFCTVADNTASTTGAVYNLAYGNTIAAVGDVPAGSAQSATAAITDSILSNTTGGVDLVNNAINGNNTNTATVTLSGPNLVQTLSGTISGTAPLTANPLLSALGNYGGSEDTLALLPGSPALDAGTTVAGVTTDERGVSRPQGSAPDLGAFESQGFNLSVTSGNNQNTLVNTAFGDALVVTVTAEDGIDPVAGGQLTFTVPSSGASAALNLGNPVTIASNGTASVNATANGTLGSYDVTADTAGVATAVEFALTNQATPTVPTPSVPSNAVYNGQPRGATVGDVSGVNGTNLGAPTLTYYDGTYTLVTLPSSGGSSTPPTNAGNYTVVASYAGSTDYTSANSLATYTISPAPIRYTIGNDTQVYGQPANLADDLPSTFSTGINGETLRIAYSSSGDTSTALPGSYPITGVISNGSGLAANYTVTLTDGILTVDQARPTVPPPIVPSNAVYNGQSQGATVQNVIGVNNADLGAATLTYYDGTYTLATLPSSGGSSTPPTNAGNYTVVASYAGSTDYTSGNSLATYSISPTTPTVPTPIVPSNAVYNGQSQGATVQNVIGVNNADLGAATLTYYDGTYTLATLPSSGGSSTPPTNAGNYTVVASYAGSTDYTSGNSLATYSISPTTPTVPTPTVPSDAVYNGQPQGATVGDVTGVNNADLGAATLTYYDGTYTLATLPSSGGSSTPPTNAGNYTVVASYPGSTDYISNSSLATYTISKAPISYTIGNDTQAYGYPANLAADLPSSFNTGINGETLSIAYSSSGDTSTAVPGTYAITGVVSNGPNGSGLASNYTVTLTDGTLTVLSSGVSVVGTELWIVGGPTSNDRVEINPAGTSDTGSSGLQVEATLNGVPSLTTYNQSFTAIHIAGFAGNDTIQEASTLTINTTVSAGNGNDNVQLGNGTNTVMLGNGMDSVQVGNGSNSISAGNGNDNVVLGNGANIVTLGNGIDTVKAGDGNNSISAGDGNDTVLLHDGNNTVTLGGGKDSITAGDGNNTITAGDGNDNVQLGGGNNTVTLGNGQDTVQLGNGDNVVVTGDGHDLIFAGNGDNLIAAGLGQHVVQVGDGSNILIDGSVQLTQAGDSLRQVLDDWIASGAAAVDSIRTRLLVTYNSAYANSLEAGSGLDWFWASYAKDSVNAAPTDIRN